MHTWIFLLPLHAIPAPLTYFSLFTLTFKALLKCLSSMSLPLVRLSTQFVLASIAKSHVLMLNCISVGNWHTRELCVQISN